MGVPAAARCILEPYGRVVGGDILPGDVDGFRDRWMLIRDANRVRVADARRPMRSLGKNKQLSHQDSPAKTQEQFLRIRQRQTRQTRRVP